jgi:dipeptidyl aminopeptidase/acylaminoacyl peptidase
LISDAAEVSAHGRRAVFTATVVEALSGVPPTRVGITDLLNGETRLLTHGPHSDRSPKFSPDGRRVAFLSDRTRVNEFQLYLLDMTTGVESAAPVVDGWIETLQWSPDGHCILLGVAGHGADVSGGQGAITSHATANDLPSWMPTVATGDESFRWRRAWVYDVQSERVRPVGPARCNIWQCVWCGNGCIAAVVSDGPSEGKWYTAHLAILDLNTEGVRDLYRPQEQLGCPAASPSGKHLAIVEALCSDRGIVAGELRLITVSSGASRPVETGGVDITYTEWRGEERLLLAGHRRSETVVALYDVAADRFEEVWCSAQLSIGAMYAAVAGLDETGNCVLVSESFLQAPEIGVIRRGEYRGVKSFDVGYSEQTKNVAAVDAVCWKAPDGRDIDGWLLRPHGKAPHPLVMNIHGGPIWQWHPTWLGRAVRLPILLLLQRGYAVLLPNPRGSSGRGRSFARLVWGDVGGADTYDYLCGIDHLVASGTADPERLGVTGGSYGGFMAAWLITQDPRFAAAVPVAPVTNQVTAHLLSNIPDYVKFSLADTYTNPAGRYFERSPIMHAHKARTPTLSICGALDRCTPPEEAAQFHSALLESGCKSVLVTYPEEGHGIRKWPAAIDSATRVLGWFLQHMPAQTRCNATRS